MNQLRDFQREDVDFLKENNLRALIASAPGTGKTLVAIRAVVECHQWSLPAVVIAPASVTRNWAREIRKWAPGVKTVLIDDMDSPIPKQESPHTIYIISWALLDARADDLLRYGVKTVIADECHYAKNPDAIRSQGLNYLVNRAKGVLLLSGTPIVNTHSELAVLKMLLGTEEPPMIRRLLEDVAPDIPQKKRAYVYVRLRPEQQAEYDKADKEFEDWLRKQKEKLVGEGMADAEVERVLAAEAMAKIGYLRRMVGEFKAVAAADWVARAVRVGEPVVVFVEHQACLRKLSKALRKQRIRHGIIEGSTSAKKRQEMVDLFQKHEFPVFIGTKAAKEGITLTAARHLLFVERFFTSAEEEQAEDRIRRIGQTHETTIWFLHAANTVDDRIDAIVKQKRAVVRTAIGAPEIMETASDNAEALIRAWGKHVVTDDREILDLGHGDPLPPLPKPSETHAVVFYGDRWVGASALLWCRMNAYLASKKIDYVDRFKMVVHPVEVFHKNSFKVHMVSKDIRIIHGKRISEANERRVRAALRRIS